VRLFHPLRHAGLPADRDALIAEAGAPVREYVRAFSSDIPIARTCELDAEWQAERRNFTLTLSARERWARHEQRSDPARRHSGRVCPCANR
jgi:hypothetical protein